MVTAKAQSDDVVEALGQGANDYVTKPVDFPVVLARVQAQLRLRQAAARTTRCRTRTTSSRASSSTAATGWSRAIGAGNFGTVYKARHLELDHTVAVKVLQTSAITDPDAMARFRREGITRLPRAPSQRGRRRSTSASPRRGVAYLVMELLAGYPLEDEMKGGRVAARGPRPAHRGRGLRGPGRRPSRRHRPPRHQARERVPPPGGRAGGPEGARLRHRQDRGGGRPAAEGHARGLDRGHARLHGAGALRLRGGDGGGGRLQRGRSCCSRCSPAGCPSTRTAIRMAVAIKHKPTTRRPPARACGRTRRAAVEEAILSALRKHPQPAADGGRDGGAARRGHAVPAARGLEVEAEAGRSGDAAGVDGRRGRSAVGSSPTVAREKRTCVPMATCRAAGQARPAAEVEAEGVAAPSSPGACPSP